MSKIVQWKRGNVAVNNAYTGANGEITVDTTNWNLRVHDGVTAGGYTIDSSNGGGRIGNLTVTNNTVTGDELILVSNAGNVVSDSYYANNSFYVNTQINLAIYLKQVYRVSQVYFITTKTAIQ